MGKDDTFECKRICVKEVGGIATRDIQRGDLVSVGQQASDINILADPTTIIPESPKSDKGLLSPEYEKLLDKYDESIDKRWHLLDKIDSLIDEVHNLKEKLRCQVK